MQSAGHICPPFSKGERSERVNGSVFAECEFAFTFECNGEAGNLVRVAERYGGLMEKAKARIEAICRGCKNFPPARRGGLRTEEEQA